jgi:YD repeat-containing protein
MTRQTTMGRPPQSWLEGNGASFTRSFDLDGRLTSIGIGGPTPAVITYVYDAANRITGETETGQPGQAFGYDALDRLTGYVNGAAQTSYSYDADGNRLNLGTTPTATPATTPQVYAYDAASNHLLSETVPGPVVRGQPTTTTLPFTYDATGNTLSDGTHQFTYDARGRMASALLDNEATENPRRPDNEARRATGYGINGLGERIVKSGVNVQPNGAVEYVYDGAGHLLGEYDANGTAVEETVYLGDLPVAVMDEHNNGTIGNGAGSIHYVMATKSWAEAPSCSPAGVFGKASDRWGDPRRGQSPCPESGGGGAVGMRAADAKVLEMPEIPAKKNELHCCTRSDNILKLLAYYSVRTFQWHHG